MEVLQGLLTAAVLCLVIGLYSFKYSGKNAPDLEDNGHKIRVMSYVLFVIGVGCAAGFAYLIKSGKAVLTSTVAPDY